MGACSTTQKGGQFGDNATLRGLALSLINQVASQNFIAFGQRTLLNFQNKGQEQGILLKIKNFRQDKMILSF
jgi:hypothetical protein